MKKHLGILLSASAVLSTAAHAVTTGSDFATGIDQWKTRDYFSGAQGPTPNWTLEAIESYDSSDFAVFSAPGPKFTGDKNAYYGGSLSFDLVTQFRSNNTASNFTLALGTGSLVLSGATVLYWYGGQPSTTQYTHFVANLSPADSRWRIGGGPSGGGTIPTEAQFRAVLGDVKFLYIPVEWNAGPDSSRLDNVFFSAAAVPEPESWATLLLGTTIVGYTARRKACRRANRKEA